jgi:hypothetical protein
LPFSGSTALPAAALADRLGRERKAIFAVNGRCAALGVHSVDLRLHLFDTLAVPVLSHGCEVWGPDLVGTATSPRAWPKPNCTDVRMVLGVNKPTSMWPMMRELSRKPLKVFSMRSAKLGIEPCYLGPKTGCVWP